VTLDRQHFFDLAARGVLLGPGQCLDLNGYAILRDPDDPSCRSNLGWCLPDYRPEYELMAPLDLLEASSLPNPRDPFWYRLHGPGPVFR
jgi:hypothetical protein